LLVALRDLLPRRPDLRVVFMSATLQLDTLLSYWQENRDDPIAHVQMQGRTFPVQEFYLEHILRMTGHLDHITGGPVDADELEKELAALTGGKSRLDMKDCDNAKSSSASFNCVLCGRSNFLDALALAEHLALCDGVFHEEEEEPNAFPNVKSVEDDSSSSDEEKYEKWDGVSTFDLPDKVSGGNDTEMLDQYQVMHNDEDIDYDLMIEVLRLIVQNSQPDCAILVFLPGWGEISEFGLMLEGTPPFQNESRYLILPLHSGIPSVDQRKVLEVPPAGVRKIVLSTNIAETSITIEDVAFVVDSGKAKEKSYDPHLKTSTLQSTWISHASAKQRRGRAGRTKAGVAFHLFSKRRYKSMRPFLESELLRTPLEEMCLLCKKLGLAPGGIEDEDGVPAFLAKAMAAPHPLSVSNALELLVDLGAMEPVTNRLTTLGLCLSTISLEPRVAKMVIWSHLLGCSRSAVDMAVTMSYKSPFVMPPPHQRRAADVSKLTLSENSQSDQITLMYVLRRRDQLAKGRGPGGVYHTFCRRNFLNASTLDMVADIRNTLNRELKFLNFPPSNSMNGYHNRHANDTALWQAAIAAGLFPNIASRRSGQTNFTTISTLRQKAKIHVSSINSIKGQPLNSKSQIPEGDIEFVAYGELVRGPQAFTMNQTSYLTSALPLLLLCGTVLSVFPKDDSTCILNLDDVVVFQCPSETASHIVLLRKRLEGAFWRYIMDPSSGLANLPPSERHAIDIVGAVLRSAHRSAAK
jgi:ATP-dependent RNA helicase DHX36